MSTELPYVLGNNRLPSLFEKISGAAKPEKFSQDFLEKLGFSSSNDRSFPRLLRFLGFLDENFRPTSKYDFLKDGSKSKQVIAEQLRESYNELFSINTDVNRASDAEMRGIIARTTGKDETSVNRIAGTFKALCALGDFILQASPKNLMQENQQRSPTKRKKKIRSGRRERLPEAESHLSFIITFKSIFLPRQRLLCIKRFSEA